MLAFLPACGKADGGSAGAAAASADQAVLSPSPEVAGAVWTIRANGRGIGFGKDPAAPYLSLACTLATGNRPPRLTIIRHAPSEPGAKALFAVLGNGIAARFKVDATLAKGEGWRWEATLPASAGEFDVFTGPHAIEATLPGAGRIALPPASLPGEFVGWCRRNGRAITPPGPG